MKVTVGTDGGFVDIDLGPIRSIGLGNLMDVTAHSVHEIAGSTSHYVRFRGGGELRFAYSKTGEILELSSVGLDIVTDKLGNMWFNAHTFRPVAPTSHAK